MSVLSDVIVGRKKVFRSKKFCGLPAPPDEYLEQQEQPIGADEQEERLALLLARGQRHGKRAVRGKPDKGETHVAHVGGLEHHEHILPLQVRILVENIVHAETRVHELEQKINSDP